MHKLQLVPVTCNQGCVHISVVHLNHDLHVSIGPMHLQKDHKRCHLLRQGSALWLRHRSDPPGVNSRLFVLFVENMFFSVILNKVSGNREVITSYLHRTNLEYIREAGEMTTVLLEKNWMRDHKELEYIAKELFSWLLKCVSVCVCMCMPLSVCRHQKTLCRNQFSPSTLSLRHRTQFAKLGYEHLYLLTHLSHLVKAFSKCGIKAGQ